MGLKKSNYEVKELGLTLETAYAVIHSLQISGTKGTAEFYIQNSPRENAFALKPLERKFVQFPVNRNENPFETAYNYAKGTYPDTEYDPETLTERTVEKPNVFYGWEDDLQ